MGDRMSQLGQDGPRVFPLAFGGWQVAGSYALGGIPAGIPGGEDSPEALVERALGLGINCFDTARHYGQSEVVLGDCLFRAAAHPAPVLVSKCGIAPDGGRDLRPESVREAVAASRRTLRRERVDAYLATIAGLDAAALAAARVLAELKDAGHIGLWGFSLNRPEDAHRALDDLRPDLLEVPYNLFDTRFAPVLERCAATGVGVMVKSPLNKGVLTGKYRPGDAFGRDDVRSTYLSEQALAQRGAWMDAFCAAFGLPREELRATALRFVLATPGVSAVAVGCRSIAHLEQNASLLDAPMAEALVQDIRTFSANHFHRLEALHA